MKIAVVPAAGLGDALIFHIASYHFKAQGFEVVTDTPHRFGSWLEPFHFGDKGAPDAIFLQHDNSERAKEILRSHPKTYAFYGSHNPSKHGPLRKGLDFVADPNRTMVENVQASLKALFQIEASKENGFKAPSSLIHRKYSKRVAIHPGSTELKRNWPIEKFEKVAEELTKIGYEPFIIPQLPSISDLSAVIYESGYFLGNDSGPGHIASCLNIPHVIVAKDKQYMRLWRPGWLSGTILTPPNFKIFKNNWKSIISARKVIKNLKSIQK
jgi:heptosyltransferase-3